MKPRDLRQEDGGVASRKLHFAALIAALIVVAGRVVPEAAVGEVVMGLVTVCGIYVGGNVATKWTLGRQPLVPSPKPAPTQENK